MHEPLDYATARTLCLLLDVELEVRHKFARLRPTKPAKRPSPYASGRHFHLEGYTQEMLHAEIFDFHKAMYM